MKYNMLTTADHYCSPTQLNEIGQVWAENLKKINIYLQIKILCVFLCLQTYFTVKYIIDTKFIISMSAKRRRLSSSFKSDSSILVSVQTTNAVETIEIINNSETN